MKRFYVAVLLCTLAILSCQKEPAVVSVANVTLNMSSVEITEGETASITATISPDNADNKTVLDIEDDAARAALGGKWRMPTDAEWTELRENCTWTWTSNYNGTGVAGRIVTSKKSGYTNKSIFLPAAGYRVKGYLNHDGSNGHYWSSSLDADYPFSAWRVSFNSGDVYRDRNDRYYGRSVRPVSE